jgi:DNA-binding NarL/FixJ family response regulator
VKKIRILLATSEARLEKEVRAALEPHTEFSLLNQAIDGAHVLHLIHEVEPHLILLDTQLPDISPVSLIRTVAASHPAVRLLGFSMSEEVESIREMLRAGAVGYILASDPIHELPQALRAALSARSVFSARVTELLLHSD